MNHNTEPHLNAGSHAYTNIYASGNSRQHNGNVINDYRHATVTIMQDGTVRQSAIESKGTKRKRDSDDDSQGPPVTSDHNLDRAVKKLGALSSTIREQRNGKPARKIIKRIQTFLSCLLESDLPSASCTQLSPYTKQKLRDLERRLRGLTVVLVNSLPPRTSSFNRDLAKRQRDIVQVGDWKLSAETSEMQSLDIDGLNVHSLMTLRIEPSAGRGGNPISVYFGERTNSFETTVLHPTIFAYRMVPSTSPVFKLIEDDDVQGFKELLITHQATTRDCDEWNRSLLYYACWFMSLSCCKLLIENGADLDRLNRFMIDPEVCSDSKYVALDACPLENVLQGDFDGPDVLSRSFQYRSMLLEAGADPLGGSTDGVDISFATSLYDAVERDVPEVLELILYKGNWSFDIQSLRKDGFSLWLKACQHAQGDTGLRALLKAFTSAETARATGRRPTSHLRDMQMSLPPGWTPAETDEHGYNCLFLCVCFAKKPSCSGSLKTLLFLLTLQIDIFACNFIHGITVFTMVASPSEFGSYQQDLWYCALERSGHQLEGDPRVPLRNAKYKVGYTPMHYHALRYLDSWTSDDDLCSQMEEVYLERPMTAREASQMTLLNRMRRRKGMGELWFTDPRTDEEAYDGEDSDDEEIGECSCLGRGYICGSSEDEEDDESDDDHEVVMSGFGRIEDVTDDDEPADSDEDEYASGNDDAMSLDGDG